MSGGIKTVNDEIIREGDIAYKNERGEYLYVIDIGARYVKYVQVEEKPDNYYAISPERKEVVSAWEKWASKGKITKHTTVLGDISYHYLEGN